MDEIVECHSEFAYAERPAALTWQGQRRTVAEMLSEWRTPYGKHFRLRTEDGLEFELAYDETSDEWHIHQL